MKIAILMVDLIGRELRSTDLMLLLAVLLITAALLSKIRKRRRSDQSRPGAREQIEQDRQIRGVRGDLERLMVEVEQLAREFSARLEAKTLTLEKLIDEADARIARLSQLGAMDLSTRQENGAAGTGTGTGTATTASTSDKGASEEQAAADPLMRSVCALADEGLSPADIAERLGEHIGKVELILALRATK